MRRTSESGHSPCFTKTSMLPVYEGLMTPTVFRKFPRCPRALAFGCAAAFGFALVGCSSMPDTMTLAFADPAKYELYDCKQLEAERKKLATRAAELKGLMDKAQTGVAGPVVAEMAYSNEYVAVRGQASNAEDAWRRGKCRETPSSAGPALNDKSGRPVIRSGNAVY
jgi:hypothetical protein